ncbi:MAG: hypothetical protein K8L97_21780 [Anaerolineae bacterium]|nr:hypothetical protein [Anaerolineae bacterium]
MSVDTPVPVTARSQPQVRAARYRRPAAFLAAFAVLFGTALTSGLYYYLVPHDKNWNVSQVMLILHIISGTLAFPVLIPFVISHQRYQEGRSLLLLMPWLAFRHRQDEPTRKYHQRLLGHTLNGSILVLILSGFLMVVPGLLWFAGIIWIPDYLAYQVSNAIHLGTALVAVGLLLVHLRGRRNANRGGGR